MRFVLYETVILTVISDINLLIIMGELTFVIQCLNLSRMLDMLPYHLTCSTVNYSVIKDINVKIILVSPNRQNVAGKNWTSMLTAKDQCAVCKSINSHIMNCIVLLRSVEITPL